MNDESTPTTAPTPTNAPATQIIVADNGEPFVHETDAIAEMKRRRGADGKPLDEMIWTIARHPQGRGFCVITFRLIRELQQRRESAERASMQSGMTPVEYFEVQVGPNMNPSTPDKQTEWIIVNGQFLTVTLGAKAILSNIDLNAIDDATTKNIQPIDPEGRGTLDGMPIRIAGWKPRLTYQKIRKVTAKEYQEYRDKCGRAFMQFQDKRRAENENLKTGE